MTAWITKYALSRTGIYEVEIRSISSDRYVYTTNKSAVSFILNVEAFETEAEARANARQRRDKKIESLRKQIAKLQAMEF